MSSVCAVVVIGAIVEAKKFESLKGNSKARVPGSASNNIDDLMMGVTEILAAWVTTYITSRVTLLNVPVVPSRTCEHNPKRVNNHGYHTCAFVYMTDLTLPGVFVQYYTALL